MGDPSLRPALTAAFPAAPLSTDAVAWPRGNPVPIGRATLAVLPFLDGSTTLDQLLDDAVAALRLDSEAGETARSVAIGDLELLEKAGVVSGLSTTGDAPASTEETSTTPSVPVTPGAPGDPTHELNGPTNGASREPVAHAVDEVIDVVVEGNQRMVTTRLADGRTRRTTTITVSASGSTEQLSELLTSVALTDLIDADACAGQKLRAGSPAHDLLVALDGHMTRIRTDHDPTLAALRAWLADSIIDDSIVTSIAQPPGDDRASQLRAGVGVSAYVIAPFEGEGPPRVYDRWGGRVARPRDAHGAAVAVAGLLADEESPTGEEIVVAQAFVVEGPRGAVLFPAYLAEVPLLRQRLERAGLAPAAARNVVLRPDGRVEVGGADLSTSRQVREVAGCVVVSDDDRHDPASVFAAALLHGTEPASITAAQRALEIVNTVAGDKPAVLVDQAGPDALTAVAVRLAS